MRPEPDIERQALVGGKTVVHRYQVCNQCTGCVSVAVAVLVSVNLVLTASLVAMYTHSVGSDTCSASVFDNSACVNLCSPVCASTGSSCFSGCYTACNETATATFERPAVLGSWIAPNAIQHVGVTTSNLTRSVLFYTEIMGGVEVEYAGGDGWKGDDVYQLLMQYALMEGPSTAQWAANLSANGPDTLSARYISFGTMVVELLDYYSEEATLQRAMQNVSTVASSTFPKFSSSNAAPSVAQNMHFSFNVRTDRDLNEFVNSLEAQAHAYGYSEVVCNRLVTVPTGPDGQPDYSQVPLTDNSYVVTTGNFKGWHLAYCKGPDGEQLEFNQVADAATVDFDQALQVLYLCRQPLFPCPSVL